jgi:hypothetical protein
LKTNDIGTMTTAFGKVAFDLHADLDVYRFEPSQGPCGELFVCVIFDKKLSGLAADIPTIIETLKDTTIEESKTSDLNEFLTPIPRSLSPYPSPGLQRKVTNILKNQFESLKQDVSQKGKSLKSKLSLSIENNFTGVPGDAATTSSAMKKSPKKKSISEMNYPLIGSYEESLLSGRLSTSPSKPLTFTTDIGVIALGKCKPSLKCPPHLIIPFNAVFYHMIDEDAPTPYVGTVEISNMIVNLEQRAPKLELGGYRLPLRGQLQIVIIL